MIVQYPDIELEMRFQNSRAIATELSGLTEDEQNLLYGLEKQIEEAESPFQRTDLQKIFDKKKKEWLEANRQLLVEENKIAATPVAYPSTPVSMGR